MPIAHLAAAGPPSRKVDPTRRGGRRPVDKCGSHTLCGLSSRPKRSFITRCTGGPPGRSGRSSHVAPVVLPAEAVDITRCTGGPPGRSGRSSHVAPVVLPTQAVDVTRCTGGPPGRSGRRHTLHRWSSRPKRSTSHVAPVVLPAEAVDITRCAGGPPELGGLLGDRCRRAVPLPARRATPFEHTSAVGQNSASRAPAERGRESLLRVRRRRVNRAREALRSLGHYGSALAMLRRIARPRFLSSPRSRLPYILLYIPDHRAER